MNTDGIRAAVLAAMMVLSVAAVGMAATGVMAQDGSQQQAPADRDEIDLELTSTQPNTVTGLTALGAINGSNVLDPQVPGNQETGKVKALKITSGGGLDFSNLALIPVPTSGIDRNGDEAGTAIDVNLVLNLQGLETINNGSGLIIKFRDPVKLSVGDEIVVSIEEANGLKTGPEGHYTLKTYGVTLDGSLTEPATAEFTIGNPGPVTHTVKVKSTGDYAAYSFSADNVTLVEDDAEDTVNKDTAYGAVSVDSDTYKITGSLDSLSVAGNVKVFVDGQQVDPSTIGSTVQVVTFEGTGSVGSYDFNTSGEVKGGIYLDSEDSLKKSEGAVNAGLETYFVDGNVTVNADSNVNVVKS